jgi:hypothetical protein
MRSLVFFGCVLWSIAHELVGEGSRIETLSVVTGPTAGIAPRGVFVLRMTLLPEGTLAAEGLAAPLPRLLLGLSYSVGNLIGTGALRWQPLPGVALRVRLVEESRSHPALAIGIQTQGWGAYDTEQRRFLLPAPGPFVAASKSYRWWLGELAWHASVGYPLELPPAQRRPRLALGAEHSIGRRGAVFAEYLWEPRAGVVNAAVRLGLGVSTVLVLQCVDLFPRDSSPIRWARAVSIEWYLR